MQGYHEIRPIKCDRIRLEEVGAENKAWEHPLLIMFSDRTISV